MKRNKRFYVTYYFSSSFTSEEMEIQVDENLLPGDVVKILEDQLVDKYDTTIVIINFWEVGKTL